MIPETETLAVGTKPRTLHCESPGGEWEKIEEEKKEDSTIYIDEKGLLLELAQSQH